MFGIEVQTNHENHSQYVEKWRKAMTEAYELAGKKSRETGTKAKHRNDRFVRSSVLQPGDRVLVRNLSERGGPGKLRSHWEDGVHIVVSRKGEDSSVYEVKPEAGTGGNRILHRNLLLPCSHLPIEIPSPIPCKRRSKAQENKRDNFQQTPTSLVETVSDGTSSEDEYTIAPMNLQTGQTLEEVVTEEPPKPSVVERRPQTTLLEDAIPDTSYQGEKDSDCTVTTEMEDGMSESGDEQVSQIPNDNSQPVLPELEPRPQRQRHPPTLLTYNHLGNPTYETRGTTHFIAASSVLGNQLPQYLTPYPSWSAGLPAVQQFQLPTHQHVSQSPAIFGYSGTCLQYTPVPLPVFQTVNQYPIHQPVVYQPRSDLMQVPV